MYHPSYDELVEWGIDNIPVNNDVDEPFFPIDDSAFELEYLKTFPDSFKVPHYPLDEVKQNSPIRVTNHGLLEDESDYRGVSNAAAAAKVNQLEAARSFQELVFDDTTTRTKRRLSANPTAPYVKKSKTEAELQNELLKSIKQFSMYQFQMDNPYASELQTNEASDLIDSIIALFVNGTLFQVKRAQTNNSIDTDIINADLIDTVIARVPVSIQRCAPMFQSCTEWALNRLEESVLATDYNHHYPTTGSVNSGHSKKANAVEETNLYTLANESHLKQALQNAYAATTGKSISERIQAIRNRHIEKGHSEKQFDAINTVLKNQYDNSPELREARRQKAISDQKRKNTRDAKKIAAKIAEVESKLAIAKQRKEPITSASWLTPEQHSYYFPSEVAADDNTTTVSSSIVREPRMD